MGVAGRLWVEGRTNGLDKAANELACLDKVPLRRDFQPKKAEQREDLETCFSY
jgi:hypothetical protein